MSAREDVTRVLADMGVARPAPAVVDMLVDVAYREMVEVAARLAESGGRGEVARRVLAGTGAEAKVGDDGVPTWLRKRFQAEVHRQYSDHLPVYCMLS